MMNVAAPEGRPDGEPMTVHDVQIVDLRSPHIPQKSGWTRRDSNPSFRGAPALDPEATFGHHKFPRNQDGLDGIRTRGLHVANVTIYP